MDSFLSIHINHKLFHKMDSINLNDVCIIEDADGVYILYHDWIFIYFFLISQLILLFKIIFKIILIWFITSKILGYFVNAINTKADPAMLEEDYQAHKTEYPLIYRIRKSKAVKYISKKGSKIRQSTVFRFRGGCQTISQILTIVVESHYTKSVRIRSVKTKLKILINDQVVGKFCAQLGILAVSATGSLVPRIVGVVIGTNVLFKPIDDASFNPPLSYIETMVKSKDRISIQTSPEQNFRIPSVRGTNQITIVTLDDKFKFMCPAQEKVGLEKSSKNE